MASRDKAAKWFPGKHLGLSKQNDTTSTFDVGFVPAPPGVTLPGLVLERKPPPEVSEVSMTERTPTLAPASDSPHQHTLAGEVPGSNVDRPWDLPAPLAAAVPTSAGAGALPGDTWAAERAEMARLGLPPPKVRQGALICRFNGYTFLSIRVFVSLCVVCVHYYLTLASETRLLLFFCQESDKDGWYPGKLLGRKPRTASSEPPGGTSTASTSANLRGSTSTSNGGTNGDRSRGKGASSGGAATSDQGAETTWYPGKNLAAAASAMPRPLLALRRRVVAKRALRQPSSGAACVGVDSGAGSGGAVATLRVTLLRGQRLVGNRRPFVGALT